MDRQLKIDVAHRIWLDAKDAGRGFFVGFACAVIDVVGSGTEHPVYAAGQVVKVGTNLGLAVDTLRAAFTAYCDAYNELAKHPERVAGRPDDQLT